MIWKHELIVKILSMHKEFSGERKYRINMHIRECTFSDIIEREFPE